jgi:hypothetical protein
MVLPAADAVLELKTAALLHVGASLTPTTVKMLVASFALNAEKPPVLVQRSRPPLPPYPPMKRGR